MVNYWCKHYRLTITKNKVENICLLRGCNQLEKQHNTKRRMGKKSYYDKRRGPTKSRAGRRKNHVI